MKFKINPSRTQLTLTADAGERENLKALGESIHQDAVLHECLEHIVCNSELSWVYPEETGDLTEAPMLGIYGEVTTQPGGRPVGHWDGKNFFAPVVERWAWMSYQVRSLLEELRDRGSATLVSSN